MIEVILNGNKITTEAGITILELAKRNGIHIPTLCHDEELNPYGSCWVCAVEVRGRRGFVTSCGTTISNGMEIETDTVEVKNARKMALELLISNHYADCVAPCQVACPDHVDIQAYVSLIANGQYHEAVKVIKDTLPMPLSIGRVCPAFCEKECRRQIVEDPIAIRQLKRYAADEDLGDVWSYVPEKLPEKGKRIAIIGAGPSGLTCGYYLSNNGYDVTIYESSPAAGGWLRYGIPEYRLPKAILDKEIDLMCTNGMKIEYNQELGRDVNMKQLSKDFDAVYLAIGAQKAVPMPVAGSDLQGCYLGVDFLKDHAMGKTPEIGKRIAIVGGGNTAIDCARTAIRLGADVTLIYRRTKEEMPADAFEIEAAEHEGVHFHYLSNPVEYHGENGKLTEVKIETMVLGEADSSGRRRPEPTGEYFIEQFDSIIAAISQVPCVDVFTNEDNYIDGAVLPVSRWQTAIVNEHTMHTGLLNVFAGGDFRRGAATAIEAIADGKVAAEMIDLYIQGQPMKADKLRFDSKKAKSISEVSIEEYAIFTKEARKPMPEIELALAKTTFKEVELGFDEAEARKEAERCLECGCQVNETCSLRQYCTDYDVDPVRFMGSINRHPIDYSHPFIVRDANKCVNCGRCIRTCAEIQGAAVLGYIYRGFPTIVAPEFGESLTNTSCESCGKCINVCPVGALVERNIHYKLNPLEVEKTYQSCGLCGTGCTIQIETQSGIVTRVTTPEDDEKAGFNGRNLCFKGRFGWQALNDAERIKTPMLRTSDGWKPIDWNEATAVIKDKWSTAQSKRFEISPMLSLEEMLMVRSITENTGAKFAADPAHLSSMDAFVDISINDIAYPQLDSYDEYVVCGEVSHTLRTLLRLKQRSGKKLILVNYPESGFSRFADENIMSLANLTSGSRRLYVYNTKKISESDVYQLWQIALGEDPKGKNVLVTSDYPNLLGLLAIKPDMHLSSAADFCLNYGSLTNRVSPNGFSIAILPFVNPSFSGDLILPQPGYQDIDGKAIANAGFVTQYSNPTRSVIINHLMKLFYELGWIHPNSAEITFWNEKAEQFITQMREYQWQVPDITQIDCTKLNQDLKMDKSMLFAKISQLYEQRKESTEF